jgi:geranylgeranyl diphosphate synthase type I
VTTRRERLATPRAAAPRALERARPLVSAGLRRAVERLPSRLRLVASYHLGWCDERGREAEGDGGKAVRPTVTLLASEAVGGTFQAALPGAVAVELVHNFSLLHDDVMDGDRERRHRPTVWSLFGVGEAILVGDALLNLAHQVLLDDPRPAARRAASELARAPAEMIAGQAEDLSFESRVDVSVEEVEAMSAHKTAALLSCAGAVGAILGGGDEPQVQALRAFGHHLGLAFQAVDDVLGIWGDPTVTGKPVANDLRQRKKTLPVAHALASGGPGAGELARLLADGEPREEAVARAVALVEAAGSREWALALAARRLEAALDALRGGNLRPGPVAELEEVAAFVVGRDF